MPGSALYSAVVSASQRAALVTMVATRENGPLRLRRRVLVADRIFEARICTRVCFARFLQSAAWCRVQRAVPPFLFSFVFSASRSVKWQTGPLASRRTRCRDGYNLSGNHPISLSVIRPNRFNQLVELCETLIHFHRAAPVRCDGTILGGWCDELMRDDCPCGVRWTHPIITLLRLHACWLGLFFIQSFSIQMSLSGIVVFIAISFQCCTFRRVWFHSKQMILTIQFCMNRAKFAQGERKKFVLLRWTFRVPPRV